MATMHALLSSDEWRRSCINSEKGKQLSRSSTAPSEKEEEEKETHLLKAGDKITTHNEMISVDEDNTEQEVTIDVDACKPNLEWPNSWLANLQVSQVDKETLTTPGAWLSDAIMNAAQTVLKKENQLFPVFIMFLGLNNDYDVETGEFVQILHNGHGHWHVISTVGVKHPTVNIFDSMYSHCSNHSKVQIASILATKEPAIRLQYMDVQMQSGKAHCGLFAIAWNASRIICI